MIALMVFPLWFNQLGILLEIIGFVLILFATWIRIEGAGFNEGKTWYRFNYSHRRIYWRVSIPLVIVGLVFQAIAGT